MTHELYSTPLLGDNALMVNGGQVTNTPAHPVTRDKSGNTFTVDADGNVTERAGVVKHTFAGVERPAGAGVVESARPGNGR